MTEAIGIRPLTDVSEIDELATDATREGHRFVAALVEEWNNGANRFDGIGESLFVAEIDRTVVGVAGLNIDPYVTDRSVGRVRRLYVSPNRRRRGVARSLVDAITSQARLHFHVLRLRTLDAEAAAFYDSIGFQRVSGDEFCTHTRRLLTLRP